MRMLTDLDTDALRVAYDAAETVIGFRSYLPSGLLLVLLGKFRDDVGDVLGKEPQQPPVRGAERHALDQLTSAEMTVLAGVTGVLLDRFAAYMDDPELVVSLRAFRGCLDEQQAERTQIRASLGAT
jgi:hypothetical protein